MTGESGEESIEAGEVGTAAVGWPRGPLAVLLAGGVLLVTSIVASSTIASWVEEIGISWKVATTLVSNGGFIGFGLATFGLLLMWDPGDKAPDSLECLREEVAGLRREVAALRSRLEGGA